MIPERFLSQRFPFQRDKKGRELICMDSLLSNILIRQTASVGIIAQGKEKECRHEIGVVDDVK